jgi:hypothetical protein
MDAQKNYDRYSNAPIPNKKGQPTVALMVDRQPAILRALAEHNTLTIYDLHNIVGGNLRALRQSVAILKAKPNEYIRILSEQLRTRNLRENLYYQLAPRGVEWLTKKGHEVKPPRRVYNLGHAGLVSHIMSSISAGVAQQQSARLISWDDIQAHPKFQGGKDPTAIEHPNGKHIRPDTPPFGIHLQGEKHSYRFLVVEADNATETVHPSSDEYKGNSLKVKFEAYLDFMKSRGFERYGLPNYFVLFVFTNETRMANAMTSLGSLGNSRYILFKVAKPDALAGYIFTTPCERVGYDPLQLNQP